MLMHRAQPCCDSLLNALADLDKENYAEQNEKKGGTVLYVHLL